MPPISNFGSMNFLLSADGTRFINELAKVGRVTQKFTDEVKVAQREVNKLGGAGSPFGGMMPHAGKVGHADGGLLSKITGGVWAGPSGMGMFARGNLASMLGEINPIAAGFVAAGAAAHKLWTEIVQLGEAADDLHDLAEALGSTAEGIVGLKTLAGKESDTFQHAMERLVREVGHAADGSEEADKKFKRLGLSSQQLAGMLGEEQFIAVADAINRLPTAAQRARAEFEIFGRTGQKLNDMISKGRGRMEEDINKAYRRGAAPDKSIGDAYEEYERAKADLEQSWQGLKNRLFGGFARDMMDIATSWNKGLTETIDSLMGDAKSPKEIAALREKARLQAEIAAAAQREKKAAEEAAAARKKAQEAMASLSKDLHQQVRALELGGSQWAKIEELAKAGATRGQVSDAVKVLTQVQEMTRAKSLFDATRTPLEKYNAEIAELNMLLDRGRITEEVFSRAAFQALETLEQAKAAAQTPLPLLQRGTQADRSFGLQLDRDRMAGESPLQRLVQAQQAAAVRDQQRNQLLGEIAGGVRQKPDVGLFPL